MTVGLIHRLVIERPYDTGATGRYGQPIVEYRELATVDGLIQPRGTREVPSSAESGSEIGDFVAFMARTDITGEDRIRNISDDRLAADDRYQVVGIPRDFGFGGLPHLEVDLRLVKAPDLVGAGSSGSSGDSGASGAAS